MALMVVSAEHPYPVKPNGQRDNDALRHWGSAHGLPTMWRGPIPDELYQRFAEMYRARIEAAPLVRVIEI
jgi:hypothetical protein